MSFIGITEKNYSDHEDRKDEVGRVVFYNVDDGSIVQASTGMLKNLVLDHEITGRPFVGVDSDFSIDGKYVVDGLVTDRPDMATTLDGDVLRNVPLGAELYVNGEQYEIEDSEIELSGPPGATLNISLYLWPYLDKRFTYAEAEN